jgi:hypothetical protein
VLCNSKISRHRTSRHPNELRSHRPRLHHCQCCCTACFGCIDTEEFTKDGLKHVLGVLRCSCGRPSQPTMTKQTANTRSMSDDVTCCTLAAPSSHASAFVCLETNLTACFVNKYAFRMVSEGSLPRSQQPATIHYPQGLLFVLLSSIYV